MTNPADFDFLETAAPTVSGNGNGSLPPPMSESEITSLLQYVPHGHMHEALKKLGGHFAALLGPDRQAEIHTIIGTATAGWEQPVDLDKVRSTVADMIELERQKRANREAAPRYDDQGYEETVIEPDVEPEAEAVQESETPEAPAGKTPKKAAGAVIPFEVLPGPEYGRASFVGATPLVPGIGLMEGGVGVLSGPSGDGKSVYAGNLMIGWTGDAAILPAILRPTRALRVMVYPVEDAAGMTQQRYNTIGEHALPSTLWIFTRTEPIQFGGSKGRPLVKALDRLAVTLARHAPIDVVVFDPLVHIHQAEENSASEMLRWLVPFREVCRQAGAAVFIIHHAGWAPDGEDARGRGSTAIRAWSDCELSRRAQSKGGRLLHRLNLVKCNFGPRWKEAIALEFNPRTLRFAVVDEADTLCSPDALVAWLTEEHGGQWDGKRADLYQAMTAQFGCSARTAQEAVKRAKDQKRLASDGKQRGILRVANSFSHSSQFASSQ